MNPVIREYRQSVCHSLQCSGRTKRQLLRSFDKLLETFEEEEPNPTPQKLRRAFGAPEEIAGTLMNKLPAREHTKWKRSRKIAVLAICFAIATLIGTIAFIIGHSRGSTTVVTTEQTYIYYGDDENVISSFYNGEIN